MLLEKRDLLLAFVLHALVVVTIFSLNQWRINHIVVPERTIMVNMVSLQELQVMMHQEKPVTKPKKVVKIKKKTVTKPKPKNKSKAKAEPVVITTAKAKPKKIVIEEDPNYDPFAPLESAPRRVGEKTVSGEKVLNDLLQKQLSSQEINRYIMGMQQAVEQQWKVPMEMVDSVKDALIELKLFRNGKVSSVRIIESSGSEKLDNTLIQAIYAAQPFDLPRQQFALFKTNTIRFFPLK